MSTLVQRIRGVFARLSDLAASGGGALLGVDDGESGATYTTLSGFLSHCRSDLGGSKFGFTWATLPAAIDRIDWAIKTAGDSVNLLRYIPPAEWADIVAGVSTYDATADVQAWINDFATHKSNLSAASGRYRITAQINLRVAGTDNSQTLSIDGGSQLNASFWLDNDAAAAAFVYDSGWTVYDVAGCSTTDGSPIVTTTGDFIASGVIAGCSVYMDGMQATVLSVDAAGQITMNRNAVGSYAAKTARIYDTTQTTLNRLNVRNIFVTNSKVVVAKTSWHAGTAFLMNGVVNSEFMNIRTQGFTRGFDIMGGWINSFKNVMAHSCREGFYIELPTYRWLFERCATTNCGGASASWVGTKIINGGDIRFISPIVENDQLGFELRGVRGWSFTGGNFETTAYGYTINLTGLPWAYSDERMWTQAGTIGGGIRFYNTLGIIAGNGVKGVRIHGNVFELSGIPFAPSGVSWIRTTGESNLVRDIDEFGNTFPDGYDSTAHILSLAASPTQSMCQSITRNGLRYSAAAPPYYGKYWKKGTRIYRQPSDVVAGSYEGWICTADSSGADGSATWKQFGTVQA